MVKTVCLMPSQNQSLWTPHAIRGSCWCSGLTIKSNKCIPISQASRHVYTKTLPEESKNNAVPHEKPIAHTLRWKKQQKNKLCEMQNAARWIAVYKAVLCQCRWRQYNESKSCLSPVAEIKQTTVKIYLLHKRPQCKAKRFLGQVEVISPKTVDNDSPQLRVFLSNNNESRIIHPRIPVTEESLRKRGFRLTFSHPQWHRPKQSFLSRGIDWRCPLPQGKAPVKGCICRQKWTHFAFVAGEGGYCM